MTRLGYNLRFSRCDSYDDAAELDAERQADDEMEVERAECFADDEEEDQ